MVRILGQQHQQKRQRSALRTTHILVGSVLLIFVFLSIHIWYAILFTTRPPPQPHHNGHVHDISRGQAIIPVNQQEPQRQQEPPPPEQPHPHTEPIATVAFAVSVTGCGADPITEGAAVLKHAIHRVSSRGTLGGKYDYDIFAIYHPDAEACALPLEKLGYKLLKRNVFVEVDEIKGEFLRRKIRSNGCCGEKELIKLEAYTLTDYPIVVHLDLDVLVLKPLDELFDMMMYGSDHVEPLKAIMWPEKELPKQVDAFYTYDYNMVAISKPHKPVQGGFLVTRPSMEVYEEFRKIVLEGDFREGKGWGGMIGPFHGAMTFQGLIPYYYDILHPGKSIELNRCIYNQMCDNPRDQKTVNDVVHGNCRIGTEECEDCRSRPLEDIVTTHFTLCQKPWGCYPHTQDTIQHRLCRKLTREWYRIRSEMEKSWGRTGTGPGTHDTENFFGYCTKNFEKGYVPIEEPYGKPV